MKKKKRRRRGFFSLSFSSFFLSLSISLSLFFFVLTRRKTGYRLSAFIGQLDRTTNFIGSEVSVSSFPFFFFFEIVSSLVSPRFYFYRLIYILGEIAILILNAADCCSIVRHAKVILFGYLVIGYIFLTFFLIFKIFFMHRTMKNTT